MPVYVQYYFWLAAVSVFVFFSGTAEALEKGTKNAS